MTEEKQIKSGIIQPFTYLQQGGPQSDEDNYEKEMVPKLYVSATLDTTLKEIQNFEPTQRPLIKMQFIKKRREFGQGYKFNEQDASERFTEIKQVKDPLNHVKTQIVDIGMQGCNTLQQTGTQTTWNRKINKGLQIEEEGQLKEVQDDDFELLKFLDTVYPLMEEALQSNETIDIYQDDFDVLPQSDSLDTTTDLSNVIKEIKSFSYLYCRGKKISQIQFQPTNQTSKSKYIVAESFVENLSFDERVTYQVKSHKSFIVFWDFEDIHSIEPILLLTSPLEITCFEFNPRDPNIVVGGAINGQVLLWELNGSPLSFSSKKHSKSKPEKNEVPVIPPKIMSALQDPASVSAANTTEIIRKQVPSHKNPVLCLRWLPNGIEIDRKIFYNLSQNNSNENHQFATISMDGQILIWDTRFGDKDSKKPPQDVIEYQPLYGRLTMVFNYTDRKEEQEIPQFKIQGQMGGAHIAFRKLQKTSTLTGTSDEGELFFMDWAVRPTEENTKADMVQQLWQNERSYRPAVGLDVSSFYEDIILTMHDFHFCVWKHGITQPIFESMVIKNAHISCGGFSPFRPGVIVIGKTDGSLDVWDFMDQSHKYTIQCQVVAQSLSYIKFHEVLPHIVAVGDVDGTLHLMEFPGTLCRKSGDEERIMYEFWEREVRRVDYYNDRFRERDEIAKAEKQVREQQEQLEQAKEASKKDEDKKDEEFDQIENEYQEFVQEYLFPQEKKEEEKEKGKK